MSLMRDRAYACSASGSKADRPEPGHPDDSNRQVASGTKNTPDTSETFFQKIAGTLAGEMSSFEHRTRSGNYDRPNIAGK
jgi:hypothetical protein